MLKLKNRDVLEEVTSCTLIDFDDCEFCDGEKNDDDFCTHCDGQWYDIID